MNVSIIPTVRDIQWAVADAYNKDMASRKQAKKALANIGAWKTQARLHGTGKNKWSSQHGKRI